MATVQSSRASKCARRGLPEDEAPEHVLSAGELLIKQLARKQTDTNMSLEQQLKNEKEFERGIGYVSIGEMRSGTSSLREFEEMQLRAERIQEFEGRGLTRGEAEAVLSGPRQSKASPAAHAASQSHIALQLQSTPSQRCEASISRREWELAASVKPNSLETRLYKFAMQNSTISAQAPSQPPGHPAHSLAQMEQSLSQIATADPHQLAKTLRRKRRQMVDAMAEPSSVHYKPPEPKSSLWDCIEPPVTIPKPPKPTRVITCRRETLFTVRDGRIVPLDGGGNEKEENLTEERAEGQPFVAVELPSIDLRVSGRITEEEIKLLPKFENYNRGTVSKILYIKNLSTKVKEADLVAVFAKFQEKNEEKIIYRLMNGKMRGQAFVTFKSEQVKTKWKYLRDTFRAELRKTNQQRSGDEGGSTFQSSWPWFEAMSFLKDVMVPRRMTSNLSQQTSGTSASSDNPDEPNEQDFNITVPTRATDDNDSGPSSDSSERNLTMPPPAPRSSKKKRIATDTELVNIEREKLKLIEQQMSSAQTQDDNYHFVMSLLPTMRKLPPESQLRARIKIQQILLDEINLSSRNLGSFFSSFGDENLILNSQPSSDDVNYIQLP